MKLYQHDRGYEFFRCQAGAFEDRVYVHRLVYVREHGFDALNADDEIHHKNAIPWDNRPSNLEALAPAEHAARTRQMQQEVHS